MLKLKSAELSILAERYGDSYFGCTLLEDSTIFRVYCPRSPKVDLMVFDHYDQSDGRSYAMNFLVTGVWELKLPVNLAGKLYGYQITAPNDGMPFEATDQIIADPYSKWVVCRNNYKQSPKSLIFNMPEFDWDGDNFVVPGDPRDLVIYESHLQDMVMNSSKSADENSLYKRFLHPEFDGGIQHLKKLHVNALEFLPIQKFAYHEPPFYQKTTEGVQNTWNRYSKNYWGYMTSFFFMPESRFSEAGKLDNDAIYGETINAINEFKSVVKALHKAGIAVIMDVVYNHVSQYDLNPLKYLDRMYYFRHDRNQNYTSYSGCGNDLKTESPLARRLIIDSVLYWMKEFHIDGFRFDLANIIDRETLIQIRQEARKINPNVLLISEPWGGGYNPTGFSEIGWPSWNDQIRNGIKGSDPIHDAGLIFGKWQRETSRMSVENFIRGTLINQPNGRFHRSTHSVNYLESHDGYTLGDFIRLVYNPDLNQKKIHSKNQISTLEGPELNAARLAAFILMVSQGITMIHAGQEFARTKLIVNSEVEDPETGKLDHNSYNKDNQTNYLDFSDIHKNKNLFDYYIGLIKLRRSSPALRKSKPESIIFRNYDDPLHFTFSIKDHGTNDPFEYFVSINANPYREHEVKLPDGFWQIMVSETVASMVPISVISGVVKVGPLAAILVRKLS